MPSSAIASGLICARMLCLLAQDSVPRRPWVLHGWMGRGMDREATLLLLLRGPD
jgi:hypothetical protein